VWTWLQVFSGRVANAPYVKGEWDSFMSIHGTVMWYRGLECNTLLYSQQFEEAFDAEHGEGRGVRVGCRWSVVSRVTDACRTSSPAGAFGQCQEAVDEMVRDVFRVACLPDGGGWSVGYLEQVGFS
jgi:hypothetical protein